jgi:WD40 repeat protein/serine/threonine protein kinase
MTNSNADRNLLFGILALQNDFISREELIAAVSVWLQDKQKSLGQILLEREALPTDEHALLVALVKKHVERHDNDPEKSLASVSAVETSIREELRRLGDADVEGSLVHVAANKESDPYATQPLTTIGDSTSRGQRFLVLRPHAKGGLGQVSVARDNELNREVALKEIQSQFADSADSRGRFVQEAEITGGLEHPGIVPVYGLGQYSDGRPFYAMRFIRGDSLKEAIDRFHKADEPGRDPTERSLELRKLLGRFIDVCQAIEYAHSRGVLHRDLKPGNVMLGKYGETLVVDWGLAKPVGKCDTERRSEEPTIRPSSGSGSAPTQMGSAIGTPAYMSPEQAAGRLDQLGPASDVYSLGATLYCVLTGQAPLNDSDLATVLRKVEKGDFPLPREVHTQVPKPLEAICLRAMAQNQQERYTSPQQLADDVERYLADEPIAAHAEPALLRVRRWVRKHPKSITGLAATLVIGLISTIVIAAVVSGTNQQLAKSNEDLKLANKAERQATLDANASAHEARQNLKSAERNAYNSDMLLAQRDWQNNNINHLKELLDPYRDRDDLKGFEWGYWARLVHRDLPTLDVNAKRVAFCPDGQRLASASDDKKVRVSNIFTGEELLSLNMAGRYPTDLTFSPDGRRLAASEGGPDNSNFLKVWDTSTGEELLTLKEYASALALSPDGTRLAASIDGYDGTKVWDVSTGEELLALSGHSARFSCNAFSPDGTQLATASGDTMLKVWDARTGTELHTLDGHNGPVLDVTFSPDGNLLASASETAKIWDASTGAEVLTLTGHDNFVSVVAFSPNGERLASAANDKTVRVWDAATGEELLILKGYSDLFGDVAFSPDGLWLYFISRDGTVSRWDSTKGEEVLKLKGHRSPVMNVVFSPDGTQLASVSADAEVKIWDGATGHDLFTLDGSRVDKVSSNEYTLYDSSTQMCVSYGQGGERLMSSSRTNTLTLWDISTRQELLSVEGHMGALSNDGRRLATMRNGLKLAVLDASSGRELRTIVMHGHIVTSHCCVALSPNGRQVATTIARGACVWDTHTGRELFALRGHKGEVRSVTYSPDGERLASGSFDGTTRVWDATTGRELLTLKGHTSGVRSVTYSPDGERLASGSFDGTTRVWDAATGRELLILQGHSNGVTSVAFSPDGNLLASGSLDETVIIWDARPWTQERRSEQHALAFVRAAYQDLFSKNAVLERILTDKTISEPVREHSVKLAETYRGPTARVLNESAWQIVKKSDASPDAYAEASRRIQAAVQMEPDSGNLLNTLGVTHYRVGDHKEALKTLTRSEQLNRERSGGESPHDIVFLAMTHHQLGDTDKARERLLQLRNVIQQPNWADDAELQSFLQEAEALIEAGSESEPDAPQNSPVPEKKSAE